METNILHKTAALVRFRQLGLHGYHLLARHSHAILRGTSRRDFLGPCQALQLRLLLMERIINKVPLLQPCLHSSLRNSGLVALHQ